MHNPHIGNKTKALVKVGIITVGTQMGTALIHKMARSPVLLFGLGIAAGIYAQIYRQKRINSTQQLKNQDK